MKSDKIKLTIGAGLGKKCRSFWQCIFYLKRDARLEKKGARLVIEIDIENYL